MSNLLEFSRYQFFLDIYKILVPFSKLRINQKKKIFFAVLFLILQVFSRPALQCQLVEVEVVEVLEIPLNDSFESFASSCDLTSFSVASVVKFQEQVGEDFLQKSEFIFFFIWLSLTLKGVIKKWSFMIYPLDSRNTKKPKNQDSWFF